MVVVSISVLLSELGREMRPEWAAVEYDVPIPIACKGLRACRAAPVDNDTEFRDVMRGGAPFGWEVKAE